MARRIDNDDVLFAIDDGTGRVAVVHLTWQREKTAEWPWTVFYDDLKQWRRDCMLADHREYRDT